MKRLLLTFATFFYCLFSFAQTQRDDRFYEAKEAFENYNFIEASDLLEDFVEEAIQQSNTDKLTEASMMLADCYLYLRLYNKAYGYYNFILLNNGLSSLGSERDKLKAILRSDQCLLEMKHVWELESKAWNPNITFSEAGVEGDVELEFIFRKLQSRYQIMLALSEDRVAYSGQMLLEMLRDERYDDINVLEKCDALLNMAEATIYIKKFDNAANYLSYCYWLLDDKGLLNTAYDFKAQFLKTVANYYRHDKAMLEAHLLNGMASIYLKNTFPRIDESGRKEAWNVLQQWFINVLPRMGYSSQEHGTMYFSWEGNIYNGLLISKGVLLNNNQSLRKFINQSGYEHLNELLDRINYCKNRIAQNYLASLYATEKSKLERELMREVFQKGYTMKGIDVTYDDIREKLQYDEAAIEFQRFVTHENDTLYMALVLTPDYYMPTITMVGNEKDMREAEKDLSKLQKIWDELDLDLQGVKKVFFAADGILHRLPIEHFTNNNFLLENTEFYRLSSTREIVLHEDNDFGKEAVIYGGFDYFLDESGKDDTNFIDHGESEVVRELRGAVVSTPALPGTKAEAEQIAAALNGSSASSLKAELITGGNGTEASFKALSHKGKSIIHIGTHGFYIPKNNETNYSDLETMSLRPSYLYSDEEDLVMERSGLLFSGSDNTLFGDNRAFDEEDGILTAREISLLDLTGCDLISLSACHTAEGDIAADGVFGLQRGFKQAGVNSILMSLWAVDDRATQILMTEFYSNLVKGSSKHESLKRAQQKVKNTKGYEDPKYWAAFILLDALD